MNLDTPIWQLTVSEFRNILREEIPKVETKPPERKFAYGLSGLAELFDCSTATAWRIKKSGKIDKAISQVGKKIVIDCDMALKLYKIRQ